MGKLDGPAHLHNLLVVQFLLFKVIYLPIFHTICHECILNKSTSSFFIIADLVKSSVKEHLPGFVYKYLHLVVETVKGKSQSEKLDEVR